MKVYIPYYLYKDDAGGCYVGHPHKSVERAREELENMKRERNIPTDVGSLCEMRFSATIVDREVLE